MEKRFTIYLFGLLISLVSTTNIFGQAEPLSANPINNINSDFNDFNPVFIDSLTMLFTSSRNFIASEKVNNFSQDIYISRKIEGEWQKAEIWSKSINSGNHDAIVGISSDRKIVFVYKHFNGGDIYYSIKKENNKWSRLKKSILNTEYHESSIYSFDSIIYITSNSPKSKGQHDIFISNNGEEPVPIEEFNTIYDETSVFLTNEGKTIYFSSNRENNTYNIYKSIKSANAHWSEPIKLDKPINSDFNEISYSEDFDGNIYISSDRDTSKKKDFNIYRIEKIPIKKEMIVKNVPIVLFGSSDYENNGGIKILKIRDSLKIEGFDSDIPNEILVDKKQFIDSTYSYKVNNIPKNTLFKILNNESTTIIKVEKNISNKYNTIEEVKNVIDFDINYCRVQVGAFLNIFSIKDFEAKYPLLKGLVEIEDYKEMKKFYIKGKIEKIEEAADLQKKCIRDYKSVEDTFIGVYDKNNERILIFFDFEKNKYILLKR